MTNENKIMIAMIFFGSLLGLLAVFEDQIFSNKIVDESEKSIGEISYQSRDVRYKNFQSYSWIDSQKTQQIYYNDAVFTGKKSAAQVQLTDGSQISIGENTLVSFKNFRNQKLLEMLNGNVRVSVNGSIRLKVGDEIQEITGRDIQLQVYSEKDQNKPMIKVLQGQATLRNREGKSVTLNKDEYRIVTRTPASQQDSPIPKPVQEIENLETPELPIVDSTTLQPLVEQTKASEEEPSQRPDIVYYWKFEDLYQMQDQNIIPLPMPQQLSMVNEFALPTEFENQDTYIQHDQNKYFSLPRDQFSPANQRSGNSFKLKSVNNGLNFVRFSKDGKNWSTPDQFYVNARFRFPAPEIQAATNYQLNPDQEVIQIPLNIANEGPRTHYIIEYNVSPDDYTKMQSKLFYGNNIQLELKQVGNYRYRIRLFKNDKFLSKWTKFKELNVGLPDAPLSPQFLSGTKKGRLGETFQFQWKSHSPNQEIITEILDESKQVVLQERKSDIQWTPGAAGKYTTRSFSVDRFGQKSSPSPEVDVAVLAPPPPKKRRPAATENALVMKVEQPTDVKTNSNYGDSRVTTSGVLWTIQSNVQFYSDAQSPVSTGAGITAKHWVTEHDGLEARVRTGIFGLNEAGQKTSITNLEAFYHRRFKTYFPLNEAKEMQISAYAGFDQYQNSNPNFVQKYSLFKIGTALDFPVGKKWSTGGEFAYGIAADQSNKREVSGFLRYHFKKPWSIGAGYRLNFFEAVTAESSPNQTLPYLDGYTEGFTSVDYSY